MDEFEQEVVDLGYKIREMEISDTPMHCLIYDRIKLIKIIKFYIKHLEELDKMVNFQKGKP